MNTIDGQLEQSGTAVRTAFENSATPDPSSIERRHRRQRTGATAIFSVVVLLAGLALFSALPGRNPNTGSANQLNSDLPTYGLVLGEPWIAGEINHNEGAYATEYWEVYNYLRTDGGDASSVVVRVTTRPSASEAARRSSPGMSAQDSIEASVGGRDVGFVVHDGTYSYGWVEGVALVDVVVIQMEKGAVTKELAETVVGNVRILTDAERSAFLNNQTSIPPGPETSVPN